MPGQGRGSGCGCIVVVLMLLGGIALGLTTCLNSGPSSAERLAETARQARAEADLKQQQVNEQRSGVRSDGMPVSGLRGQESSSVCVDGERDDTSGQGILDIDQAIVEVSGDDLLVHVSLFPVLKGGLQLVGGLKLISASDPNLWVSYSNDTHSHGGRIGTDSAGSEDQGQLFVSAAGDDEVVMSVPVEDFAELGDNILWEVTVAANGVTDSCPNDGRQLRFSLSELAGN